MSRKAPLPKIPRAPKSARGPSVPHSTTARASPPAAYRSFAFILSSSAGAAAHGRPPRAAIPTPESKAPEPPALPTAAGPYDRCSNQHRQRKQRNDSSQLPRLPRTQIVLHANDRHRERNGAQKLQHCIQHDKFPFSFLYFSIIIFAVSRSIRASTASPLINARNGSSSSLLLAQRNLLNQLIQPQTYGGIGDAIQLCNVFQRSRLHQKIFKKAASSSSSASIHCGILSNSIFSSPHFLF